MGRTNIAPEVHEEKPFLVHDDWDDESAEGGKRPQRKRIYRLHGKIFRYLMAIMLIVLAASAWFGLGPMAFHGGAVSSNSRRAGYTF